MDINLDKVMHGKKFQITTAHEINEKQILKHKL